MAENDIAPGFARVIYYRTTRKHVMNIPVSYVGTPVVGSMPTLQTKDGVGVSANVGVTAWVAVARVLFNANTTITDVEFWHKPTPADDPIEIWTESPATAGNNVGAAVVDAQLVMTFRTLAGGIAKHYLMETAYPVNVRDVVPFAQANWTAYAAYCVSGASWLYARDNSYLYRAIVVTTKTNDALRQKSLLDA